MFSLPFKSFFFFFKRSFAGKLTIEIAGYFLLALRWSVVVTPQMLHEAQKVSQHFYRPFPRPLDRVCLLWSKLCLWLGSPVERKRITQYTNSRTGLRHFKRIQWMRELAAVYVTGKDTHLNSTSKAAILSSLPYPSLTYFNYLLLIKLFFFLIKMAEFSWKRTSERRTPALQASLYTST